MTGEAGESASSLEEQWKLGLAQMTAIGPGQVDYHRLVSGAQGTMGIVTWASIKCEILPQVHKLYFIPAGRLEDLIDCAYRLLRARLGDEFFLMNNTDLATILSERAEQINTLRAELPNWVIVIAIAGRDMLPQERLEFQESDIRYTTQQFGVKLLSAVSGISGTKMLEAILNPSKEPYWKLRHKSGCQDIFFLTTLNRTPEFIKIMCSVAEAHNYPVSDIGIYLQPQQQGVSCHCEFNLPYDSENPNEVANVRELTAKASEELIKQGAFFSRPYNIWANMVYSKDAQSASILKKIKNIFDPNNILNPGKLCF